MMTVVACITQLHNLWLVGLAALVCMTGSFVTLDLYARSLTERVRQRIGWTFLASIAAGASVWCTHFIAMLAYEVNAPVTYDPILTMLSLIVIVLGAGLAFRLTQIGHAIVGGAVLGTSISAMHFTGMIAYRVDGFVNWNAGYVAASVVIAIAGSAVALSYVKNRAIALTALVASVVGLHFTAMTAVSVEPFVTGAPVSGSPATIVMAIAVAGVGLLIVGTGLLSRIVDADMAEENVDALRRMALYDALTNLPNRVSYTDHTERELSLAASTGEKCAVLGIDLDRFKEINDTQGHGAGDTVLRIIGQRLTDALRGSEFVARMGGDEFAATKRYRYDHELEEFVRRIEAVLFSEVRIGEFSTSPGASIGIATWPSDGETVDRLTANADLAMYRAKADHTRAICYYETGMDEQARARRELAADLRHALENDEFEIHYQVQMQVAAPQNVIGYEILLRWTHPLRGSVPPSTFIPVAEETGLIIPIGEWVLRTACKAAAAWERPDRIAVNLSALQLAHADISDLVAGILAETGLAPERLELELTESCIIQDKKRSLDTLRRIRALGVTIAIDDFGTGYSSLDTLRSFPFDRIKLDRSFMSELEDSMQSRAIIRAVLALSRSLDISVLAEGVETPRQLELLRQEGCDEAQGFLLGRPGPVPTTAEISPSRQVA
ncbi:putative bifunctional diguanylate cyclase/phosphodiesterase [Aliihoeflea sp. PC F10.4]